MVAEVEAPTISPSIGSSWSSSTLSAPTTAPSSVSSASPTPATLPTPPKTTAKPIKLRAACNHCFTAKVRCDGNKEGCRRCSEKRLSCVYSESRVGKVVGKRRKRPLEDASGNINAQSWIISTPGPLQSIPSPATTHGSEDSSKTQCPVPNWPMFIAGGDPGFLRFDEAAESFNAIEMANSRSYSVTSELTFFNNSGLPTPALSPPQFARYLSPSQLEARPTSSQAYGAVDPSKLYPARTMATSAPHPDTTPEDEEVVCIKLLAHLKRHSADESQPRATQLALLKKCNAAVRRILHSKTIRSDYSCHLLLSNILSHLVRLCERLCHGKSDEARNSESQFLQDQVHFETVPGFFDHTMSQALPPQEQDIMLSLTKEVTTFASTLGDMLKRKPLSGFQSLGRHETFHVELEQRLRRAAAQLYP